jgi:hypothetical protein
MNFLRFGIKFLHNNCKQSWLEPSTTIISYASRETFPLQLKSSASSVHKRVLQLFNSMKCLCYSPIQKSSSEKRTVESFLFWPLCHASIRVEVAPRRPFKLFNNLSSPVARRGKVCNKQRLRAAVSHVL